MEVVSSNETPLLQKPVQGRFPELSQVLVLLGLWTTDRPSSVSHLIHFSSLAPASSVSTFMTVASCDSTVLVMPVRTECCTTTVPASSSSTSLIPPAPINTHQPGVATSLLYGGSQFRGYQKSKGNAYDVEVVLQVKNMQK